MSSYPFFSLGFLFVPKPGGGKGGCESVTTCTSKTVSIDVRKKGLRRHMS